MRGFLVTLALALALGAAVPAQVRTADGSTSRAVAQLAPGRALIPVVAMQIPDKKVDIDIDINRGGGGVRWYRNPTWVAIGAIAAVVVLLLVIVAARGGGTTVVKD